MIKIGSLFSGIGGFELGLERAIPNSQTVWQCEQNQFCQQILAKHWPNAVLYDDVRTINNQVEPIDILCGGFPCQSISVAGKMEGLENENKSGLWWEMWRIIGNLRPRIVIMENVSNIIRLGGSDVVGSLTQIGYDTEWAIIRADQFGAPHQRSRWFCVAYQTPHPVGERLQEDQTIPIGFSSNQTGIRSKNSSGGDVDGGNSRGNYWEQFPTQSAICRGNDGISNRVDRVRALGNAIVPQCSEWIGLQILNSGLLDDLLEGV